MPTHPQLGQFPRARWRRMRKDDFSRRMMRQTTLTADDLIQPLFIHAGTDNLPIASMAGMVRLSEAAVARKCEDLCALGIPAVALFPAIPAAAKSAAAEEAWNPRGLVQRAVAAIKQATPDLGVITDLALDPYTSDGQDGLCDASGYVENDRTVAALVRQALSHLAAGADVVAPSDMMDGRVRALREACEENGYANARILAYSAKYASNLYAPFRAAVGSAATLQGDKRSYQMDPANADEALRETASDIAEGADMVMIKPGLPNLDIIWRVKQAYGMPTFAYQVSGEYAMLRAAAENGWLDEAATVLEILHCFKRAGCDGVLTYYAEDAARWLAA